MTDLAAPLNDAIRAASPALDALLSPLGRRAAFPPDIPFQAAQAKGKRFNATIGQITDGRGGALPLPALAGGLSALPQAARNRALLYAPVEGFPDLRQAWRERQRRGVDAAVPSSLPIVTVGLTHGLALIADLFGGEGKKVLVPAPFWGNYRQTFALRTGATVVPVPVYRDGCYDAQALPSALAEQAEGEPVVAMLNLPSNPGGTSLTGDERATTIAGLLAAAEQRPLMVLCDDAYAGLVYEPQVPRSSLFWELAGRHPNLLPVKVDGATKELSFFGGRVGFLTFPFAPESAVAEALASKVKCLVRATVGSPVASSQALVLEALRSPTVEEEVEAVRSELAGRYRTLQQAVADLDPGLLRPLPCNSGCFALLELAPAVVATADQVRRHLLEVEDTGLVAIQERYLRIAFCSVPESDLAELVTRVVRGVATLAGAVSSG